jgi:hypothetical protein
LVVLPVVAREMLVEHEKMVAFRSGEPHWEDRMQKIKGGIMTLMAVVVLLTMALNSPR